MLNRREALLTMAGTLAAFILPAPRRHIDLKSFCRKYPRSKYGLTLPYALSDWTYATDGSICVRVRPESADVVQHTGEVPPFDGLGWNHDRLRGWKEMPRLQPLLAHDSDCPACDGYGFEGGVSGSDCPACDGTGNEWLSYGWGLSRPIACGSCKGEGVVPPPGVPECSACHGKAHGVFPSLVSLDGRYFDVRLYEKARHLGAEYVMDNWHSSPDHPLIRFRFPEGKGLLLGMHPCVKKRLVNA